MTQIDQIKTAETRLDDISYSLKDASGMELVKVGINCLQEEVAELRKALEQAQARIAELYCCLKETHAGLCFKSEYLGSNQYTKNKKVLGEE